MALNKEIVKRIDEKSKNDISIKNFLMDILEFESEGRGWYEKEYIKIIEEYCGGHNNAV